MSAIPLHMGQAAYGAAELRSVYERNWLLGLSLSVLLHGLALFLLNSFGGISVREAGRPLYKPLPKINLIPVAPPSFRPPQSSQGLVSTPPKFGIPVPVPEGRAPEVVDFPTQAQLSSALSLVEVGEGNGIGELIEEPPPPFVAVEVDPKIIRRVQPEYPKLALQAGLEGKVFVRIWVDKQGNPREVEILRSEYEIFNDSVLKAAREFLFTPAYMNSGPVSVWVTVPFVFRLTGSRW